MATRIDHVEQALSLSGINAPDWREPHALAQLAEAQVHATLALVEQQRIANLIALASLRVFPDEIPPLLHLAIVPKGELSVGLHKSISEGLGL